MEVGESSTEITDATPLPARTQNYRGSRAQKQAPGSIVGAQGTFDLCVVRDSEVNGQIPILFACYFPPRDYYN